MSCFKLLVLSFIVLPFMRVLLFLLICLVVLAMPSTLNPILCTKIVKTLMSLISVHSVEILGFDL